mmetsp:Transcript_40267/g.65091  ORF Transcript_40267/g.65091 Transcript_40267/m.65091 type:complete len:262 (-) Transcript_40267:980-1765(-)
MMPCAASSAPLSMDHMRGEIDCVPTVMLSIQTARLPRGAQSTALLSCVLELMLMAFMTIVEPSRMVRTSILEMRPKDQLKASSSFSSWVKFLTTSMQEDTKGPKSSVGGAYPTCLRPRADTSSHIRCGSRRMSTVISRTLSAMKWRRVVDCLNISWPAGAIWKKVTKIRRLTLSLVESSKEFMKRVRAISITAGLPKLAWSMRSTFSQNQPHATSYVEFHSLGTKDRRDASITALYADSLILCLLNFASRIESTSHSSCSR